MLTGLETTCSKRYEVDTDKHYTQLWFSFSFSQFEESKLHFPQRTAAAAPLGATLFQHCHKHNMWTETEFKTNLHYGSDQQPSPIFYPLLIQGWCPDHIHTLSHTFTPGNCSVQLNHSTRAAGIKGLAQGHHSDGNEKGARRSQVYFFNLQASTALKSTTV